MRVPLRDQIQEWLAERIRSIQFPRPRRPLPPPLGRRVATLGLPLYQAVLLSIASVAMLAVSLGALAVLAFIAWLTRP